MPLSPQELQVSIEPRIRTMRTLWIAMLISVGFYYLFTLLVGQPTNSTANNTLSLMLAGVGLLTTLMSFPIKNKILVRSVTEQRVESVQQAHVIAWAMTEVAALLGLLDFFLTGNRYYYLLFLVAAIGQVLHFPRRQQVMDACFKSGF